MTDPVELYMRIVKAMRAEDDSVTLKYFAPDFVVHEDPGMPYGGVLNGASSFLKLRLKVYDTWGPDCLKLLFVCGEPNGTHAAAYFKIVGQPAGAFASIESYVTVMWTFRDDLAVEARVFYYDTPRLSKAIG
jgi:hypothetical protein